MSSVMVSPPRHPRTIRRGRAIDLASWASAGSTAALVELLRRQLRKAKRKGLVDVSVMLPIQSITETHRRLLAGAEASLYDAPPPHGTTPLHYGEPKPGTWDGEPRPVSLTARSAPLEPQDAHTEPAPQHRNTA